MNKLPSVFVNKNIIYNDNNQKFFYSKVTKKDNRKNNMKKVDVFKKINDIFSSPKYIYKIPVKLETYHKTYDTFLVAKNNTEVVTIENDVIKINDIINVEEKRK